MDIQDNWSNQESESEVNTFLLVFLTAISLSRVQGVVGNFGCFERLGFSPCRS